jgi:hypothetical protein
MEQQQEQEQQRSAKRQLLDSLSPLLHNETAKFKAEVIYLVSTRVNEDTCAVLVEQGDDVQWEFVKRLVQEQAGAAAPEMAVFDPAKSIEKFRKRFYELLFGRIADALLMWGDEAAEQQPAVRTKKVA